MYLYVDVAQNYVLCFVIYFFLFSSTRLFLRQYVVCVGAEQA